MAALVALTTRWPQPLNNSLSVLAKTSAHFEKVYSWNGNNFGWELWPQHEPQYRLNYWCNVRQYFRQSVEWDVVTCEIKHSSMPTKRLADRMRMLMVSRACCFYPVMVSDLHIHISEKEALFFAREVYSTLPMICIVLVSYPIPKMIVRWL